jgi:23S rRNA G2445 N2-methylase RlmL
VTHDIVFSVGDFVGHTTHTGTLISNPPYGNRLQNNQIDTIYQKLVKHISEQGGGFITSYDIGKNGLANKKLLNGGAECRFWYKKGA